MLHTPCVYVCVYVCACVCSLFSLSPLSLWCWGVRKGLEAVVEWLPGIFQSPNLPPSPAFFSSLYPRGVRTSAKKKKKERKKRRQDSSRTWYNATSCAISTLSRCLVCLWIQTSAKGFERVQRGIEVSLSRGDLGNWWSIFATFRQHFFFWIRILEKNLVWM